MKKRLQSSLLLLAATIIWGCAFVAQTVGMDHIGPFTFQAVRCFLAVIALLPVIWLFDGKEKKQYIKKWRDPVLWKAGIPCGLALFVAVALQQVALMYTTAGKAGFITAMYIVIVPMIGLLLGRKVPVTALIGVLLAVAGLYLLSYVGVAQVNIGDVMLVGCAIAFAVQITFVDKYAAQVDGLRLNCAQSLICAILSAVFMFILETPKIGPILQCWLSLCYAGVLSMGLAYSLQIIGQKNLEPTTASLLMSLESVFAALAGWLLLHETMSFIELSGCALVFAAVILSQISIKAKEKSPN